MTAVCLVMINEGFNLIVDVGKVTLGNWRCQKDISVNPAERNREPSKYAIIPCRDYGLSQTARHIGLAAVIDSYEIYSHRSSNFVFIKKPLQKTFCFLCFQIVDRSDTAVYQYDIIG